VRANGTTAWVEVISERSNQTFVIDADFSTPPLLLTSPSDSGALLTRVGRGRFRISGLPAGGAAVLHAAEATAFVVRPLPGNRTEHNYYGFKIDTAPLANSFT
jgi:hypothetical protein